MWDFLELIFGLGEAFASWRFYVCLVLSLSLVGLVYLLIPHQGVCVGISFLLVFLGICSGIFWQWSKG